MQNQLMQAEGLELVAVLALVLPHALALRLNGLGVEVHFINGIIYFIIKALKMVEVLV